MNKQIMEHVGGTDENDKIEHFGRDKAGRGSI